MKNKRKKLFAKLLFKKNVVWNSLLFFAVSDNSGGLLYCFFVFFFRLFVCFAVRDTSTRWQYYHISWYSNAEGSNTVCWVILLVLVTFSVVVCLPVIKSEPFCGVCMFFPCLHGFSKLFSELLSISGHFSSLLRDLELLLIYSIAPTNKYFYIIITS